MSISILTTYYPLIASITAMLVSQSIKLLLMALSKKPIYLAALSRSGGMPSSHSALITSITLCMGLKEGFDSNYFFISVILSFIVIYDARGIRHTVGQHAKLLNTVNKSNTKKLNESVGHTLPEIIVGICLGAIISFGMYHLINI
ncbi:MAG: divergent PAP2 family protein [Candidatus Margulisiibacteriota bacterium]|nr:divergent PAP2 family protein [Candidatus Margulisiibacteriota bacterium]